MIKEVQEASVHLQVVVEAPIERAFRVFTEEFDRIKPREHNLMRSPIAETVSGATLGAATPVPGYFGRIREICDRHGVLLPAPPVAPLAPLYGPRP